MTRFDDAQLDQTRIGGTPQIPVGTDNPWLLGDVRIDALTDTPPVFRPGVADDLECAFRPMRGMRDHIQRYRAARSWLELADEVMTWTAEGQAYYGETHNSVPGRQLAKLAPLAPGATGADPESRESVVPPMWVVIVGGDDETMQPEERCLLSLEVVPIGTVADYPTREHVLDAAERGGYGP